MFMLVNTVSLEHAEHVSATQADIQSTQWSFLSNRQLSISDNVTGYPSSLLVEVLPPLLPQLYAHIQRAMFVLRFLPLSGPPLSPTTDKKHQICIVAAAITYSSDGDCKKGRMPDLHAFSNL